MAAQGLPLIFNERSCCLQIWSGAAWCGQLPGPTRCFRGGAWRRRVCGMGGMRRHGATRRQRERQRQKNAALQGNLASGGMWLQREFGVTDIEVPRNVRNVASAFGAKASPCSPLICSPLAPKFVPPFPPPPAPPPPKILSIFFPPVLFFKDLCPFFQGVEGGRRKIFRGGKGRKDLRAGRGEKGNDNRRRGEGRCRSFVFIHIHI